MELFYTENEKIMRSGPVGRPVLRDGGAADGPEGWQVVR